MVPMQQQQVSSSSSGEPTAAESRAFFQQQESLKLQAAAAAACTRDRAGSGNSAAGPLPPVAEPQTAYTPTQLLDAAKLLCTAACPVLDGTRLPRRCTRWTAEVLEEGGCIASTIGKKLDQCSAIMKVPQNLDWKFTKKSQAECYPYSLFDALLDATVFTIATTGLWDVTQSQITSLRARLASVSAALVEIYPKLTQQVRLRSRQNGDCPEGGDNSPGASSAFLILLDRTSIGTRNIIEGISKLQCILTDAMNKAIAVGAGVFAAPDALLETPEYGGLAGSSRANSVTTPQSRRSRGRGIAVSPPFLPLYVYSSPSLSETQCVSIFHTVDLLTSNYCRTFCESANMQALAASTVELKAAIESAATQRSSLHRLTGTHGIAAVQSGIRKAATLFSSNARAALTLLAAKHLGLCATNSIYELRAVQDEMADALTLSTYLIAVTMRHFHDLAALLEDIPPSVLQTVRRRIKAQTAAVNSGSIVAEGIMSEEEASAAGVVLSFGGTSLNRNLPSATPVSATLVSAAAEIPIFDQKPLLALSRPTEVAAITDLWYPLNNCARPTTTNGPLLLRPPADRINNLLVWLAWEGGLTTASLESNTAAAAATGVVYRPATPMISSTIAATASLSASRLSLPLSSISNAIPETTRVTGDDTAAMEDVIMQSVIEGARNVHSMLAPALPTLFAESTWAPKGDDILALMHRTAEALVLRCTGEVNARGLRPDTIRLPPTAPRWRYPLFRATTAAANLLSGTFNSALLALLGEYCIQHAYYASPTAKWHIPIAARITGSAGDGGLVGLTGHSDERSGCCCCRSSSYAVGQLNGALKDNEVVLRAMQTSVETALNSCRENASGQSELEIRLKDLSQQVEALSNGVIDRHSNQIKVHTDRLEFHQTEIRRMSAQLSNHQGRLEAAATETKRAADVVTEFQADAKKNSIELLATLQSEITQLRTELASTLRQECLSKVDAQLCQNRSEWVPRVQELGTQVSSLVRQYDDGLASLSARCVNLENALQAMRTSSTEEVARMTKVMKATENFVDKDSIAAVYSTLDEIRETLPRVSRTMTEEVGTLCSAKLYRLLAEILPGLVNRHVAEALNASAHRPPLTRRSRFAIWSSSPARSSGVAAPPLPTPAPRPSPCFTRQCSLNDTDEVSNAEDLASVMEELHAAADLVDASGSWENVQAFLKRPDDTCSTIVAKSPIAPASGTVAMSVKTPVASSGHNRLTTEAAATGSTRGDGSTKSSPAPGGGGRPSRLYIENGV